MLALWDLNNQINCNIEPNVTKEEVNSLPEYDNQMSNCVLPKENIEEIKSQSENHI